PAAARGDDHLVTPGDRADHDAPGRRRGDPGELPGGRPARIPARTRTGGRGGGGRPRPRGTRVTPAAHLWALPLVGRRVSDYVELTKPRVVAMVLVTTLVGYWLGTVATPSGWSRLQVLLATALA